jgi:hypothetical protein
MFFHQRFQETLHPHTPFVRLAPFILLHPPVRYNEKG